MAGVRTHATGYQDPDLSPAALDALLTELHAGDDEHFGIGVSDESGKSEQPTLAQRLDALSARAEAAEASEAADGPPVNP